MEIQTRQITNGIPVQIPAQPENAGESLKTEGILKDELEIIEGELEKVYEESGQTLGTMLQHILSSRGKRIRPLLILETGRCFGPITPNLIRTAVAFELIHIASLIHDDIIDASQMRHKMPTLNSLWGNHYSTLAGDYLFAKAFEILVADRLFECLDLMVESIKLMCEGEINQQEAKFDSNVTMDSYYRRIYKKTACLISNCCKTGALISGSSGEEIGSMAAYGINIGYAFQIIDDILDFTGKSQETGKPVGLDLLQGNVTLPVILLNQVGDHAGFIETMLKSDANYNKHFPELVNLLNTSGSIAESYRIAREHIAQAKESLHRISPGPHRDFLENIADIIVERIN